MPHHPEENRREQILDATLRVFAQKGFSFYGPGSFGTRKRSNQSRKKRSWTQMF